jgi:hypothetical protein
MNLTDLQKIAKELYRPLFLLEDSLSHRIRKPLAEILLVLAVLFFSASLVLYGADRFLHISDFLYLVPKVSGLGYISLSLWFVFFALNTFFYSFYFQRPENVTGLFIDFDLAYSVCRLKADDITGSFFSLLLGSRFLLRTGISKQAMKDFLIARKTIITADKFTCDTPDNVLNLSLIHI